MKPRIWALLCALVPAVALGQVYESRDAAGNPVFSDTPAPGAKPVDLPPPNVIQTPQLPAESSAPPPAAPAYTRLRVVWPEQDGTIHSNTGEFQVKLAIEPGLATDRGDVVRVMLDGRELPQARSTTDFTITAAEFQAAASDEDAHSLAVAVTNRDGALVIQSPSVTFYAHRATAEQRRRRR
jgi:Domain of unknown function (DUF4124)